MKAGYAALLPLIRSATELPYAECFTLTMQNGDVFRYTNLDVPVWLAGNYFTANAVRIQGLKFKQSVGLEIDEQSITLIYSAADTIYGLPWGQAIRQHVLDGAKLKRERAFFDPAAWAPNALNGVAAVGGVVLFDGRITTISGFGRTTAAVSVKSNLVLLDVDFPVNDWQASCLHALYGPGCGLSRSNYLSTGTVGAGATYTSLPTSLGGSGATFAVTMSAASGGPIQKVVLTSAASVNNGYATAPTVTVTDPTGAGAVLKPILFTGYRGKGGTAVRYLASIVVVSPGSNYTNPTVVISGGTAGTATADAILPAGSISVQSVQVLTGGSGYGGATQLVFNGGGGVGAAATPIIAAGVITGVTLTNGGGNYNGVPTLTAADDPFTNYSQGTLMFQGGQNAGTEVQIKDANAGMIFLAAPLNYLPASGDVFTIWPGCDHTRGAGGCKKFNNLSSFRGYPFVPPPETAY